MAFNLLPKGTGRRRAADEVERLRRDIIKLLTQQAAADDAFMLLHQELTDARGKQAEAEEIVVAQQADIDDLTAERDHWRDETLALRKRFAAELAAEANATRVTVPSWVRDTSDPADQATGPIDVSPCGRHATPDSSAPSPTPAASDPTTTPSPSRPSDPPPAPDDTGRPGGATRTPERSYRPGIRHQHPTEEP